MKFREIALVVFVACMLGRASYLFVHKYWPQKYFIRYRQDGAGKFGPPVEITEKEYEWRSHQTAQSQNVFALQVSNSIWQAKMSHPGAN